MIGDWAANENSRHAKAFWEIQLQTDSSGVGGKVDEASREPFDAGQLICPAVTFDSGGELGGFVALY
jgi:hypothetical protein